MGKRSSSRLGTEPLVGPGAIGELTGSDGAVPDTPPPAGRVERILRARGVGAWSGWAGATLASTRGLPSVAAGRRLGAGRGAPGGGAAAGVVAGGGASAAGAAWSGAGAGLGSW